MIDFILVLIFLLLFILSIFRIRYVINNFREYIESFILITYINCLLFIIIPCITYISNYSDYSFSIFILIKSNFWFFITFEIVLFFLISFFNIKYLKVVNIFFAYLYIVFIIQYLFFDKECLIDGSKYYWREHVVASIFSFVVYFLLAIICISVIIKKTKLFYNIIKKTINILFVYMTAILLVSLLFAKSSIYFERGFYFSADEQYTVSKNENVIMFIWDAVDNSRMLKIIENELYDFENYKDFTLYTNTCSVYWNTYKSIPQMLSGGLADGTNYDYEGFYTRLHDNNYKVNVYNYEAEEGSDDLTCYFDNFYSMESNKTKFLYNYDSIRENSLNLVFFQVLPNMAKSLVKSESIEFISQTYTETGRKICYDNEDFYNNLLLKTSESNNNYFIVYHLDGTHAPIAANSYIDETIRCLKINAEYIRQLKELGIYDNATIIITADHGVHHDDNNSRIAAPTPMFLIKEPNVDNRNIKLSSAPIYHTDLLATILKNANLLYADDSMRFGHSIYDFKEGENRIRTFCEPIWGSKYNYVKYEYVTNSDELGHNIDNKSYQGYE